MAAAQPTERWVLAIGGETQGLSPEWEQFQCQRIGIKMARGVESFNAGVAGALLMDRLMGR
jgi:tRNA G18 (ribose-2'-O)-methylase SpoU